MSAGDSAKKVPWIDLCPFILGLFSKVIKKDHVRGKFMWAGAWVEYMKESYHVPEGYNFDIADLNKAIRLDKKNFALGIEWTDVPNAHGVCRDCITQEHPTKGSGSRTKHFYYAAVEPGRQRPKPPSGSGKKWYDDVWICAPKPAKKGAPADFAVAAGTSAMSNSKNRKAKKSSAGGRKPGRPVSKRKKDDDSLKRKALEYMQAQEEALGRADVCLSRRP